MAYVNMGLVYKKWLSSQSHNRATNVFVGPLLTKLCEGFGLERRLGRELVIAEMESLTQQDLERAKVADIEKENEQEVPPPRVPLPEIPPHFSTVHSWESIQAFQYRLHLE
nr:hypothetical protein Iba_chr13dCG5660 [Ipomoea batatas]